MQYGDLTAGEQTTFNTTVSSRVRKPAFAMYIEGIGDVTDDIRMFETDRMVESPQGRANLGIGRAYIIADNTDGIYYSWGRSLLAERALIRILAGYSGLSIPVLTGYVKTVSPIPSENAVYMTCMDNMGLFYEGIVEGSQGTANTPKLILEAFCGDINVTSSIPSTSETNAVFSVPTFERGRAKSAIEEMCNLLFMSAYFDETGVLQLKEREYKNDVSWIYNKNNIIDISPILDTEIINTVIIEYKENMFSRYVDQASIDDYGPGERAYRCLIGNSVLVSEYVTGQTSEELDNDIEAIKITSSATAKVIDTVTVRLAQSGASGDIKINVYTDDSGPDVLLGESKVVGSGSLYSGFVWAYFKFDEAIEIDPSTVYWIGVDTTDVSAGTVYMERSSASASSEYAVYSSGSWSLSSNKKGMHRVYGSPQALRAAEDIVLYFKSPRRRFRITAPANPAIELFDEILIDIDSPMVILGKYKVMRRHLRYTPIGFVAIDDVEECYI